MRRSKKKSKLLPILIIIFIVFSMFSLRPLNKEVTLTIDKGLSTVEISDILKENDVIKSRVIFLATVNFSKYRGQLKYGEFTFNKGDSYSDVVKKLATKGAKRETVSITIPEGYSVEKIIVLLEENGFGTKNEIKNALNKNYDYEFLNYAKTDSNIKYKLQGFLFPATYEFFADETPENIINKMLSEFEKQYKSLSVSYDNIYEIITKASLVEREAKIDSERSKIAGVINNRIKNNMKLQIDATVVYAISDGLYDVSRVLYKDLEINSPYNTYRYEGLPIGPIANPGIKSIKATINPENHSYLYYRTDESKNDGSHIFTETFEAHTDANS